MYRVFYFIFFFAVSFSAYAQSCFLAKVDNLRVRNEPGLSSQTIFMLGEGSIIESTGSISDIKEEVELRGIIYRAPFYQIRFADNREGWVYGAAIQQISEFNLSKDTRALISKFYKYLLQLGHQSLENGGKAYDYFNDHSVGLNEIETTAMSIILESYMIELSEELYDLLSDLPYPDMSLEAFLKSDEPIFQQLQRNGMKPVAMEGSFYPEIDYQYLKDEVGSKVTMAYLHYVNRIISDKLIPLESDGGIIIPIEDVAVRAMKWKEFNDKFPNFPLKEKCDAIEKHLKLLVLTGMDYTPAFNWEGKVEEIFIDAWQKIIREYSNDEFTQDLIAYTMIIKDNKGMKSPKLETILKKYYTDYMLFY